MILLATRGRLARKLAAALLLAAAAVAAPSLAPAQQSWAPAACDGGNGGTAFQSRGAGARCEGEIAAADVSRPLAFEMMGVAGERPVATCASDQLFLAVARAQGRAVRVEGKSADRGALYRLSFPAEAGAVVVWPTGDVLCKTPGLRPETVWVRAVDFGGPQPQFVPLRVEQSRGDGAGRPLNAYVRATQTIRGLEYRQRLSGGNWSDWRSPPRRRYGVDSIITLELLPGEVTQELELRGELRDGSAGGEVFAIGSGS